MKKISQEVLTGLRRVVVGSTLRELGMNLRVGSGSYSSVTLEGGKQVVQLSVMGRFKLDKEDRSALGAGPLVAEADAPFEREKVWLRRANHRGYGVFISLDSVPAFRKVLVPPRKIIR